MADPKVQVLIDWNRDGDFSDAASDISNYWIDAQWHVGIQETYQHTADETRLTMLLNNVDRRFSPENVSSPYYGSIVPMTPIKIQMVDTVHGTIIMWSGYIDQVIPEPGKYLGKFTTFTGVGPKQFIQQTALNAELLIDKRSDEAAQYVLDRVLSSAVYNVSYDLETGTKTFSYVGDKWEGADAYSAIKSITDSEDGRFFFDRRGTAIFWSRQHLLNLSGTVTDGTVNNAMVSSVYQYAEIYNNINVTITPRSISSGTVILWQLEEPITIKAGGTQSFRVTFFDQDAGVAIAGTGIVQPSGIDFVVSAGSANITSFNRQATAVQIAVANAGTVDPAVVDTFIIRGQKLKNWNTRQLSASDQTSIDLYGERRYTINAELLSSYIDGNNLANAALYTFKNPVGVIKQATFRIPLEGTRDETLINYALNFTIGDTITIIDDQLCHNSPYAIIGEQHHLDQSEGAKILNTTFILEPISRAIWWKLGISQLGIDTRLA